MPQEIVKYQLHELCNKTPEIIISTDKDTDILIRLTDEGTILSFPFGNELEARDFGKILVKARK